MAMNCKHDPNCIVNIGSQSLHPTLQLDSAKEIRKSAMASKHARDSETFPVDDLWARLIVFALGNPHLLEGSLRMSTSHFMIDWNVVSWIPLASLPMKLG